MSMLMMESGEPEFKMLKLADIKLRYVGSLTDVDWKAFSERLVFRLSNEIETESFNLSLNLSGDALTLDHITFSLEGIYSGSVIVKITAIGAFVAAATSFLADYPSAKENLPIFLDDLKSIVEGVLDKSHEELPKQESLELRSTDPKELEAAYKQMKWRF
jgi:hypothetical protein